MHDRKRGRERETQVAICVCVAVCACVCVFGCINVCGHPCGCVWIRYGPGCEDGEDAGGSLDARLPLERGELPEGGHKLLAVLHPAAAFAALCGLGLRQGRRKKGGGERAATCVRRVGVCVCVCDNEREKGGEADGG